MFKQATLQSLDRFRDTEGVITSLRLRVAIEDDKNGTLYTEHKIEGEPLAGVLAEPDKTKQGEMVRRYMETAVQEIYTNWAKTFSQDSLTAEEAAEMFGVSTVIGGIGA